MSADDDLWKAPGAEPSKTGAAAVHAAGSGAATDVLQRVINDVRMHPGGYFAAGFAYFAVAIALIVVVVGVLMVGMAPGLLLEDETLLAIGGGLGFLGYMGGIFGFSFVVYPLMTAAMIRGLHEQDQNGTPIGFGTPFRGLSNRAGAVIGFYLLTQTLVLVGILFFYIPGIIIALISLLAMPILVIEGVSPTEALQRAFKHFTANIGWHLMLALILFACLIALELTIVGLFIMFPVLVAFQYHGYRVAFPQGGGSPA